MSGVLSPISPWLSTKGLSGISRSAIPTDKALAYLYSGAVYNLEVYSLNNGAKETPQELRDLFLRFLKSKKLPS
jgi:hypothetical protein